MSHKILLASGSPQRRAILTQLGLDFRVVVPQVEEISDGADAFEVAAENARRKALSAVGEARDGELVVGVDTIVVLDGNVYGKPVDAADASRMLQLLHGRTHRVLGGLCMVDPSSGEEHEVIASTSVTFRNFLISDLNGYLASGEWKDRAGGYAIQGRGAMMVDSVSGCYQNVVGFPVADFLDMADTRGLELARTVAPAP